VARWHPPDKSPGVASCTIITTAANELVRPIHHRMPAILCDPEAWEAWLDLDSDVEPEKRRSRRSALLDCGSQGGQDRAGCRLSAS
jgi:putative SOS response-associated peptidase YedK